MKRGEIWWATLGEPTGSGPGLRRPVLILQSDPFNASRIATVVVAVVTSNLELAAAPGNVRLKRTDSGLARVSVVNVSQILTIDRNLLTARVRALPGAAMLAVERGLRLVLALA
jgi:mRNA interferase MazF